MILSDILQVTWLFIYLLTRGDIQLSFGFFNMSDDDFQNYDDD